MKLILSFLLFLFSSDMLACYAPPKEDYSRIQLAGAEVVVVGKVLSTDQIENRMAANMRVKTSVWLKGNGTTIISLVTELYCTREFSIGGEYVFLVNNGEMVGSYTYTPDNLAEVYDDIKAVNKN